MRRYRMLIVLSAMMLTFVAVAVGCESTGSYDALENAVMEAVTPEEKEKAEKRLWKFEHDAEMASEMLEQYAMCDADTRCTIMCKYTTSPQFRSRSGEIKWDRIDTTEKLVRWYRETKTACSMHTSQW